MATTTEQPTLLDISAAAERLKVSKKTIRRYVADGTLPSQKLGEGRSAPIRISAADLDHWVSSVGGEVRRLAAANRQLEAERDAWRAIAFNYKRMKRARKRTHTPSPRNGTDPAPAEAGESA